MATTTRRKRSTAAPPKAKVGRQKQDLKPGERFAYNVKINEEALAKVAKTGGRRPDLADKLTVEKKAQFVKLLRDGATIVLAADEIGVSRTCLYEHRQNDEDFAAAWDVAYEQGTDALEAEAERRALRGVSEPVFHRGEIVGHVQKYSDILLIFLLKARRPDKFRENIDVSNKDGSLAAGFAAAVRRAAS